MAGRGWRGESSDFTSDWTEGEVNFSISGLQLKLTLVLTKSGCGYDVQMHALKFAHICNYLIYILHLVILADALPQATYKRETSQARVSNTHITLVPKL